MRGVVLDRAAQPIRNLVGASGIAYNVSSSGLGPGPNFTLFDVAAGGDGYQGRAYRRATITAPFAPGSAGLDVFAYGISNFGISTLGMSIPTVLGRPYSFWIPVRSTIAQKMRAQAQGITATAGGNTLVGPDVTLVPNTWTLLPLENWIPTGATVGLRCDADLGAGPIAWSAADRIEVGRPFIYEGSKLPAMPMDGRTPGWKWSGTTDFSESVGWPYTLEAIAGKPYLLNDVPGTIISGPDVPGYEGRTCYGVFDVIDFGTPSQSRTIFQYGNVLTLNSVGPDGGVALRRDNAAATWVMNNRAQNTGGTGAFGLSSPPTLASTVLGRHIAVGWLSDGITTTQSIVDGSADPAAVPVTPGTGAGMPKAMLSVYAGNTSEKGVAAYLFRGAHNRETRLRVTAWLARKYGAPIPAGY